MMSTWRSLRSRSGCGKRFCSRTSASGARWQRLKKVEVWQPVSLSQNHGQIGTLTHLTSRFDKPAILLAAFDCSPAPVSISRKVSPTCQSAASSLHFDSSMQRLTLEEYFRGELEL